MKAINLFMNRLAMLLHPSRFIHERNLRKRGIEPRDFYMYNLPWLRSQPFDLVLDIGAARGGHTLLFHQLFAQAEIHAFEPLPVSFNKLRFRTRNLPRVVIHEMALSDKNGMVSLKKGGEGYDDSSSLLEMAQEHCRLFPGSGTQEIIEVETGRLDDVIDCSKYKNIFIKMDVQGAEHLVIRGGHRIFSTASVVVSEVSFCPLYEEGISFENICSILQPFGLVFCGMLDQVYDRLGEGRIIQGDAIFCGLNNISLT